MQSNRVSKKEDITLSLEYKKPRLLWRIVLGILLFFVLVSIISSLIVYRRFKNYQTQFLAGAQITKEEFEQTVELIASDFVDLSENPNQVISDKTLLILGADQVAGRNGGALLTDTIILIKLDLSNNLIKSLALPRDLYHVDYQTKINALYYYGREQNPDNPLDFPTQAISELIAIDIDHTLLIEIEALETLIDLVGGVEVIIDQGFTDPLFPKKGVDVTVETDPEILYEAVAFHEGQELMDGNRALQYMRSRHSEDDQGTDLARGQRQQRVLQALLAQVLSSEFLIKEPEKVGKLYRFYLDHFASSLTVNELARIMISWLIVNQNNKEIGSPKFVTFNMPVFPEDKQGLIVNPPLWQTQQQWIYQIRDLNKFRASIQGFFSKNELD